MPAPTIAFSLDEPEAQAPALTLAQARTEDAHWERYHSREHYFRPDRDYEDYAPAYCAGYVGFAQYGGSFEDAERSLVANWLRIRGDSRLGLEEAGLAMRAAWRRMEQAASLRWNPWQPALVADAAAPPASIDALQQAGTEALGIAPFARPRSAAQALRAQP